MINFTFKKVDSKDLLEEVYRLRFQVYARECHFIKEEDYPDGKETDKFDPYSIHFAAIDDEGFVAGALRLVLDSPFGFPIEEHYGGVFSIKGKEIPRKHVGEISRLVISKSYRRRKGDGLYYELPTEDSDKKELRRRLRPMVFGLYRLLYQESKRRKIFYWYAAMEESLYRLLSAHGFNFKPIGKPIEYYGIVTPYLGIVQEIEKSVQASRPDYFQYFIEGLEKPLLPASDIL